MFQIRQPAITWTNDGWETHDSISKHQANWVSIEHEAIYWTYDEPISMMPYVSFTHNKLSSLFRMCSIQRMHAGVVQYLCSIVDAAC